MDDNNNNFSPSDRQTLIELRVDMRYTKEAVDRVEKETRENNDAAARENKEIWKAIGELRKFRWSLAGGLAVAAAVGAALVEVVRRAF